ncbi:actin-histidine N-methyltransferase-like [Mustelus asterias]
MHSVQEKSGRDLGALKRRTMGKKSRVKTQKSGGGATATVSTKEIMNLITELLQKCSNPSTAPGKEWEEYVQIRGLVEKIRRKQKGLSVVFDGNREHHFDELLQWAADCGASTEGFEITYFPEEGYGLKATKDIKAEELFLWIPRKMLMTVESAKNSVLGPVYTQDRILQAMGNITLAFHLLCERLNPNSFWLPYIKTLPMEYHTPLYFEEEEVHYLQSTQAIHDVFSQYKNTARQYAYFYKLIQTHPNASKLPLKESFTFDDYRPFNPVSQQREITLTSTPIATAWHARGGCQSDSGFEVSMELLSTVSLYCFNLQNCAGE